MKRRWFRDQDGTYFRNCNNIQADIESMSPLWFWNWPRLYLLTREWEEVWRRGVRRKDRLGPNDIEATPTPMREAYPNHPGLWYLDGSGPRLW